MLTKELFFSAINGLSGIAKGEIMVLSVLHLNDIANRSGTVIYVAICFPIGLNSVLSH